MIKSLRSLYSFLHLTPSELEIVFNNIDCCYTADSRPKKKYEKYQRNKYGRIKYRDLLVPAFTLKRVQQRITNLLQKIDLPHYMYGSVPNRNHIMNAQQHLNQIHFLTIDLKQFFPNITYYQVHKMFLDHGFSYSTARILTKLTTYYGSLPQGAPSSPVIANLVFLNTATKLFTLAKRYGITYTNYLDDQSFSSTGYINTLTPEILQIIRDGGFSPAHNKIHYRTYRSEVTGLIISGNRLQVNHKMRKEAEYNANLRGYVTYIDKCNLLTAI